MRVMLELCVRTLAELPSIASPVRGQEAQGREYSRAPIDAVRRYALRFAIVNEY
jgi:hypothetical protein